MDEYFRSSCSAVIARLDRAIQYAAAYRSTTSASGILDCPVKPGNDSSYCCTIVRKR
jgi:hypothetical protein